MIVRVISLIGFLVGMSVVSFAVDQGSETAKVASESGAISWSSASAGLQLGLQIPGNRLSPDESVSVKIGFRNASDKPIRVYLVNGEFFRSFQSYFFLKAKNGDEYIGDVSPPHGYVITEKDFHLIEPQTEAWFEQSLRITPKDIPGFTPDSKLTWVYSNAVDQWQGGLDTMDGKTSALFGGGKIPFIWLGKTSLTVPIKIAQP